MVLVEAVNFLNDNFIVWNFQSNKKDLNDEVFFFALKSSLFIIDTHSVRAAQEGGRVAALRGPAGTTMCTQKGNFL
jgi:hypothetical protein